MEIKQPPAAGQTKCKECPNEISTNQYNDTWFYLLHDLTRS